MNKEGVKDAAAMRRGVLHSPWALVYYKSGCRRGGGGAVGQAAAQKIKFTCCVSVSAPPTLPGTGHRAMVWKWHTYRVHQVGDGMLAERKTLCYDACSK